MLDKKTLERARKRLILALDVDSLDKAIDLVKRLHPFVGMFKVGLELLTAGGAPRVVAAITEAGGKPFFDGKFDDIPNTVGNAVKQAAKMGVKIINLHATAGMPALLAAVANKGRSKMYAVTVLTSIDEENSNILFGGPTKATVLQLARQAALAGCDGIICSPQELEMLKNNPELGSLKRMTPGIRPAFAQINDQKRVMTPAEAIKAGAHYVVIGRPITNPTHPDGEITCEEAAQKVLEEIAAALGEEEKAREKDIAKIFEQTKAIITGSHIVYTSGKHGEAYVNKDAVYPHTALISKLCSYIAEDFEDVEIDAVVGPVVGGVALAQWIAHHLSKLQGKEIFAISADKVEGATTPTFVIKRGQEPLVKGKKVLVAEDILTTGGSAAAVVEALKGMDSEVVGVGVLCNRGGITPEVLGVPELKALMNVSLDAYDEADCPYCKKEVPINTTVGKGAEYLQKKKQSV